MYKYITKLFEDSKIYAYNYYNGNIKSDKIYPKISNDYSFIENDSDNNIDVIIDDNNNENDYKQLRIDILLSIKHYKNTYYKYTNHIKFNQELYDSFINDNNFDDNLTAFDDEDENIRIFDKYIIDYIKNKNNILTYLQCKNKVIDVKTNIDNLKDIKYSNEIDILFIMDMSEKELFIYCFNLLKKQKNISNLKNILFSIIFKYDYKLIRIKLESFKTNNNTHPYIILEKLLN
jgi:hypothetical protein